MESEERLYRALGGEDTDRVPTLSILADPNIINQVNGRGHNRILEILWSERGGRLVDRYAERISRLFNAGVFLYVNQVADINYKVGFDGVLAMYWRGKLLDRKRIEDAFGRSIDVVDDGYGNAYMMYRDGLIGSPEEWRAYRRPGIAEYASAQGRLYRLWRTIWRKKICVVPFVGPGLWENSWQPMGFARFVALLRKDPDFVCEAVGYFTALSVASVDAYCRAGARVLAFGEDLAYKSGPMMNPTVLDEFYAPGYRQITATAHRYGARIIIHCCGNTTDLIERFVDWGFDGAHSFEPSAGNDLARAREKVGDRLCLVGNIDITHTLVDGTRREVKEEVARAIGDTRGGGFILAPAHTHSSISVERVRWMLETAREEPARESAR